MPPRTSENAETRRRSRTTTDDPANASDDDQGPARKRTRLRVTTACEECRRRKERCDGGKPACQRCMNVGRTCSYNQGRKRGLKTGYVRGLEILLGLFLYECPGAEDLALSVLRGGDQGHLIDTRPRTNRQRDAAQPTSLLECWGKSPVLEELQKTLAASQTDEDEESFLQSLNARLTEALNGLPRIHNNEEEAQRDEIPMHDAAITVQFPTPVSTSLRQPTIDMNPNSDDQDQLYPSLPLNSTRLLDIYADQVHSFLPIIPKHTLLRSHSLLRDLEQNHSLASPSPGDTASLWAAMAYGAHVSETIDAAGHTPGNMPMDFNASQLLSTAISLATKDEEIFEPSHVHAFLILALLRVAQGSWTRAWLWLGKSIYAGASINLFPYQGMSLSTGSKEDSKRLFFGCFFFDSLLSTALGHRPYFQRDDLEMASPVPADGMEEWEIWHPLWRSNPALLNFNESSRSLSAFNDLVFLSGLLNDLGRTTLTSSSGANPQRLLDEFLGRQSQMVCLHFGTGASEKLVTHPPHLSHLTIASAISYLLLRMRARSSMRETRAADNLIPPKLKGVVDILSRTSTLSSHLGLPHLPPTAGLFFRLLELHGMSSTTCPLRHDWMQYLALSKPQEGGPERRLSMGQQAQGARDHAVLAARMRSPGQSSMYAQFQPSEASHSIPDSSIDASLAMPQQDFGLPAQQLTAQDGAGGPTMPADSVVSDDTGLFGQLSLLDRADW
jgi:hypothetical protein